ncbi:WD repeat-containing protein 75 [Asparagus officinalis]|uniref:WD repeat-containing protein 75 n=1 Tax=Asparagus officinalis TaxID=4686 RepID=UPI00098DEC79|nr:WD repeat-containing protein 75 [Asparagus officinalis]
MITGGNNFVSSAPVFSNDAKKLLVCTGNTVSIFSTDTGMLVTELEGHTDLVTSVVVVPVAANARKFMCYCWTSSRDSTICYWDFAAPELVKKIKVQLPIVSMVIPHISSLSADSSEKLSNLYAFVSVEDINKPADQRKALRGQIQIYNLTNSRRVGGLLAETRRPELISMSSSGEFIGIKNKQKIYTWRIPTKEFKYDDIRRIKLHHTKKFNTLAFHPSERIIAGGDVTGRILIWRGFGKRNLSETSRKLSAGRTNNEEGNPGVRGNDDADSCSTWHWHPEAVHILFFSSDGAYLYSGGKEGVLVVWQLDTGKKRFKPRLGSPLLYYTHSPDPSLSCISCADNSIHLIKMPSMAIVKSIGGIKLPFSFPDMHKRPSSDFAFDYSSGLVALRTSDHCIQFFSLFENFEVSQVQVCERNFQPVDDPMVFVALMSLSGDGSMMSTVEVRLPEEGLGDLITLKFWARGSRVGEYNLVTVIYEPHSYAEVSALAFRSGYRMAVSTSLGGEFKVWLYYSDKQKDHQKSGWRCQSVGSYKKMPMTAAAFSADGSVLAVAAETVVTLWDPDKNALVAVIGDTFTPITTISFAGKSDYIVTLSQGSNPQLAVWDLSNLSIVWSYKLRAEAVACTEDLSQFAVLVLPEVPNGPATGDQNGIILLFDVKKPVPLATWMVKKAKKGSLAFMPPDTSRQHTDVEDADGSGIPLLVYINGDHEYIIFDPHKGQIPEISRNSH